MKKIYIPHLDYTVWVKNADKAPEDVPNAKAWVANGGFSGSTIFLNKKRKINPGDLAHELIHVLQFLSLERNINFQLESEHFGYLMHYLMGQILGYKWE